MPLGRVRCKPSRTVVEEELPPGMSRYVFGLLRRAPGRPEISADKTDRIQEAHLAGLRRLLASGDLIAAGPFEEDRDERGLLIFRTSSIETAKRLMQDDEALVHGRLTLDLYTWWGPSGLTH